MIEVSRIRPNMAVIAADGRQIGIVNSLPGRDALPITSFSGGAGYDHVVPLAWVSAVDKYVHLNKMSGCIGGRRATPEAVGAFVSAPVERLSSDVMRAKATQIRRSAA